MTMGLTYLSWLAVLLLEMAQGQAATVAVMPVQGVNLSPGECDAIGVLFADAFAHQGKGPVISPMETRAASGQGQTAPQVAAQLGAAEYVELRAVRLDAKVSLSGVRYTKDGAEIFRAETAASSLDAMDAAMSRLAYALAWRANIHTRPLPQEPASETTEEPAPAEVESATARYPKALGVKAGMILPAASGRSFLPAGMLQFDARFGTRDYFIELGAGFALALGSESTSGKAALEGLFAEVGASFYLADGPIAPYLGAGLSPRIWGIHSSLSNGISGAIYGQAGVTFTRDSRLRIYAELRVSQNVIGIPEYADDGSTAPNRTVLDTYHPTELGLQLGIGW